MVRGRMAVIGWIGLGIAWAAGGFAVGFWHNKALVLYVSVSILVGLLTVGLGNRASGMSAYSVFNEDGKRLDGQLTASQFEDEMMHKDVRETGKTQGGAANPAKPKPKEETESERMDRLLRETRKQIYREARVRRR
uniref:SAYSvFN domain-containing protein n=1 Tax=Rhodosorus marinus TaxID=101924 RepID=A0A7S2ZXS0_9RHOD|mmetsp:Transcript_3693/g.16238  ORF Transcript_3693/g.16238 Transcript_3693/m.16238 type:complete len:136 (+) Transcript_3693:214-621(+)